jgi:UDP-hydrolysing UDP-N-acetyl-D-glucosamine 2-epimerase
MRLIHESDDTVLQTVVTGSHLSLDHGLTHREISDDGFIIDYRVNLAIQSDSPLDIAYGSAKALSGVSDALGDLKPDIVVLLGDRYEVWAAGAAATIIGIPIAHVHGGELTLGAMDDVFRHCLTKMAHLHFVANREFADRVVQLGEDPERVFDVGAIGLDGLQEINFLSPEDLSSVTGMELANRNILVTMHPTTLEVGQAERQVQELLKALSQFPDVNKYISMPNADSENRAIGAALASFVHADGRAVAFSSLGRLGYLSLMRHVDAVVGNSSSGIIEAPTLKVPTVDIGRRQQGRPRARSVVHCQALEGEVRRAIETVFSASFRERLVDLSNPYEGSNTIRKIYEILTTTNLDIVRQKKFRDLPLS